MSDHIDVVVIGGGQAGLAVSHELTTRDVEHVVLERGRVGETWRGRWDSFCLVTPNWTMHLPGRPYDGTNPDGFDLRDDIVRYLERYAASFDAPVRDGVAVTALDQDGRGRFTLTTSAGAITASRVVVATGAYQKPHRPTAATSLPDELLKLDVESYRNPAVLPPGSVLIVGSGQSGCQLAEELRDAGREVYLSCGRAPWAPRRIGDHDLVWWLRESGFLDAATSSLPSPSARLFANVLTSGHDGGHDLHLRTLLQKGVTLLGHFTGAGNGRVTFANDLAASVAWGDERYRMLRDLFTRTASERGIPVPDLPDPEPFASDAPTELQLGQISAVIFAGGFRPDYGSWINIPGAFDESGFPRHHDGASTTAQGLYFVGVHFLRTRKSSLLMGVGEDAAIVAAAIAGR